MESIKASDCCNGNHSSYGSTNAMIWLTPGCEEPQKLLHIKIKKRFIEVAQDLWNHVSCLIGHDAIEKLFFV